jgi:hypothetical protein
MSNQIVESKTEIIIEIMPVKPNELYSDQARPMMRHRSHTWPCGRIPCSSHMNFGASAVKQKGHGSIFV